MDETHRFLRYVMPGALFFIEALFLLLLLLPGWTVTHLHQLLDVKLGSAFAAFLGLGGMGFLFSIFHHCSREVKWLGGVNHCLVIERLRERNVLQLFNAHTGNLLSVEDKPDRHGAWAIVNALWHERVENDLKIKGANPRADTLADIVHSIGAARVGVVFAIIFCVVSGLYVAKPSSETNDIVRFILTVGLAAVLLFVHDLAYRQISDTAENLIAEILEDALTESFWGKGRPVRTFVTLAECRKRDC
jgi:hypothetical protein